MPRQGNSAMLLAQALAAPVRIPRPPEQQSEYGQQMVTRGLDSDAADAFRAAIGAAVQARGQDVGAQTSRNDQLNRFNIAQMGELGANWRAGNPIEKLQYEWQTRERIGDKANEKGLEKERIRGRYAVGAARERGKSDRPFNDFLLKDSTKQLENMRKELDADKASLNALLLSPVRKDINEADIIEMKNKIDKKQAIFDEMKLRHDFIARSIGGQHAGMYSDPPSPPVAPPGGAAQPQTGGGIGDVQLTEEQAAGFTALRNSNVPVETALLMVTGKVK